MQVNKHNINFTITFIDGTTTTETVPQDLNLDGDITQDEIDCIQLAMLSLSPSNVTALKIHSVTKL